MQHFLGVEAGAFNPACINLVRSANRYLTLETID